MESQYFRRVFSEKRVRKYFERHQRNEELAIDHYVLNIELSECFYAILSLHEVCLRNKIDQQLTRHFYQHIGTREWHEVFLMERPYRGLREKLQAAVRKLSNEGKEVTRDNIIPELHLGFWTRLFNDEYSALLWQPLRRIFINMPRPTRQRRPIKRELNHIRRFRNRIFHQEPISWHSNVLEQYHHKILHFIRKMDMQVWYLALEVDNFPVTFQRAKNNLPQN